VTKIRKNLETRDNLIKELDPDYFMCTTCNQYRHVTHRCKQKMLKQTGQPDAFRPSTRPLCIPCNGKDYWEWEFEEEQDIISLYGVDIEGELVNMIGTQIDKELSRSI